MVRQAAKSVINIGIRQRENFSLSAFRNFFRFSSFGIRTWALCATPQALDHFTDIALDRTGCVIELENADFVLAIRGGMCENCHWAELTFLLLRPEAIGFTVTVRATKLISGLNGHFDSDFRDSDSVPVYEPPNTSHSKPRH